MLHRKKFVSMYLLETSKVSEIIIFLMLLLEFGIVSWTESWIGVRITVRRTTDWHHFPHFVRLQRAMISHSIQIFQQRSFLVPHSHVLFFLEHFHSSCIRLFLGDIFQFDVAIFQFELGFVVRRWLGYGFGLLQRTRSERWSWSFQFGYDSVDHDFQLFEIDFVSA